MTTTGTGIGLGDDDDGFQPGDGTGHSPAPNRRWPAPEPLRTRVFRTEVCRRCDAPEQCCHCAADVAALRRFATRMAMIHQPTGTQECGCGTHNCYVRTWLDDLWRKFWR